VAGRVELLRSAPLLLAEGSVVERVRRAAPALLHPELLIATLARERRGRALLETIWRGYLHVARDHGLPIVLLTPTWRADGERVARAGLDLAALMRENVSILQGLREEHLAHGARGCSSEACSARAATRTTPGRRSPPRRRCASTARRPRRWRQPVSTS